MPPADEQRPDEVTPTTSIDTTRPSVARCYDAMLGGKDNFAVDRALITKVLDRVPSMYEATGDNRSWLTRVVRFLANHAGIDQFLDCGSGLPTAENTHQVAQRANRDAVVVYVDNDPTVLAHGRALLEENDHTRFTDADLTRPDDQRADPIVAKNLDFSRPIGLLLIGALHHVDDADDPHAIMRRYVERLPSGSFVAVSHFYNPGGQGELARTASELEEFAIRGVGSGRFRSFDEITRFFDGLDVLEPGIVRLCDWWPDGPRTKSPGPGQELVLGGLARKP